MKKLFQNKYLLVLLLVISAAIVYVNSLRTPFVFDDIRFTQNPEIYRLDNITAKLLKNPRSLTYITFALNYHFGKLNVLGYHLFNIVIHFLAVITLFFFSRKVLLHLALEEKNAIFLSFFVSLVFAVHPVNAEVVTYVYNRSASLAALFYMLALIFFIKAVERNGFWILITFLFFAFSIMSKETAVTLPLALIALDYFVLKDSSLIENKKSLKFHLMVWLVLAVIFISQLQYLREISMAAAKPAGSKAAYLLTQPWLIVKYLQLLIAPYNLCIDHKIETVKTLYDYKIWIPLFSLLVVFIIMLVLMRRKTGFSKILSLGMFWFFITLIPTSLINVHVGERHLYLPEFGFFLVLISLVFFALRRIKIPVWFVAVLFLAYASVLGYTSLLRNRLYQNPLLLWQEAIARYPYNAGAYDSLGEIYEERNDIEKALSYYDIALAVNPSLSLTYNNRGNIYYMRKEYDKALEDYNKAIETNKEFADAYYNRGNVYNEKKEYGKAIDDYTRSIELKPDFIKAYNNRGNSYYGKKIYDKALADYKHVIEIKPDYSDGYFNLAIFYFNRKDYARSWEYIDRLKAMNLPVNEKFVEELRKLSGRK